MKTAYEFIVLEQSFLQTGKWQIERIQQLLCLSRQMPWLLDPRVKFQDFNFPLDDNRRLIFEAKRFGVTYWDRIWIYIEDLNYKERQCAHTFIERITKTYNLQPGWMNFEDGI